MTKKEINLTIHFLKEASEELSNNGCNDVDEKVWEGWTKKERKAFVKEYHEWNGNPGEYQEEHLHLPDFAIADFLAYKLALTIKKENE